MKFKDIEARAKTEHALKKVKIMEKFVNFILFFKVCHYVYHRRCDLQYL